MGYDNLLPNASGRILMPAISDWINKNVYSKLKRFGIMTTGEGTPLPLIYGTVRVDSPALIWWGSPLATYSVTQGDFTAYSVNLLFNLGVPAYNAPTFLRRVWWGDVQALLWGLGFTGILLGDGHATQLYALSNDTPGGHSATMTGVIEFHAGSSTQQITNYPSTPVLGQVDYMLRNATPALDMSLCSGYRNQILVGIIGTSGSGSALSSIGSIGKTPQLPTISFEVVSGNAGGSLNLDANPASVLLDLFTGGPVFKLGIPTQYVDVASFNACGAVLANEGNGCSMILSTAGEAVAAFDKLLEQVNGVIYQDPSSGLIRMRLIRNDYASAFSLPQITQNNAQRPEYSTSTYRNSINAIKVTYPDRLQQYQQGMYPYQKLGSLVAQDSRFRQIDIEYPYASGSSVAIPLAARDLYARSRPVATARCGVQRQFYSLVPGDAVAVSWPQFGISEKVMRCRSIDHGQLADGAIHLELVEDVFSGSYGAALGVAVSIYTPTIYPLTKRLLMEAPRWWTGQAWMFAQDRFTLASPDLPVTFSVATPDDTSTAYSMGSRVSPSLVVGLAKPTILGNLTQSPNVATSITALLGSQLASAAYTAGSSSATFTGDVPLHAFPPSCTLVNAYSRTLEPYDTTSNQLVVQGLTGALAGIDISTLTWPTDGSVMVLIVDATGTMEFVLFESATNLGSGQYQLNNVWRGLLDTPAISHAAGALAYVIATPAAVGTVPYANGKKIQGQPVPRNFPAVGSGKDPIDTITMACRAASPYPPADMRVGSDCLSIAGTLGVPSDAGHFKAISRIEEGFDVYGRLRDRRQITAVTRGDAAPETVSDDFANGAVIAVVQVGDNAITPTNQSYGPVNEGLTSQLQNQSNVQAIGAGGDVAGYGAFDICMYTQKTIQSGDFLTSILGLAKNAILSSVNPARVTATFPSWRNLLKNARWNYYNGSTSPSDCVWDNELGTTGTAVFVSSTTTSALGNVPNALRTSSAQLIRGQRAELCLLNNSTGAFVGGPQCYQPRGLYAIACGYFNESTSSTDSAVLKIEALGKIGNSLANASTTITSPNIVSTRWTYAEILLGQMPAATQYARATITLNKTSGNGSQATELAIFVGQFASNTSFGLLANNSFEANLASWTVDSGTWIQGTGVAGPSGGYANNSGASNGQIHQDVTLPTGYEYSTATLRFWTYQSFAANTYQITVQVLDGGNNVLASTTTGAIGNATQNAWYRSLLTVDTVDGATKLRVIIVANYTSGANAGFAVDDLFLMVHKRLDASSSTSLTFDTPTVQSTAATWQDYHLAYPTLSVPTNVFSGNPSGDTTVEWSDGATRAAGLLVGQFSGVNTAINAYPFTRTAVGSQLYVRVAGATTAQHYNTIGQYSASQSFTAIGYFRVDEPSFGGFCGLFGRMNASRGWGINVTAGGQLEAMLRGASNTQAATSSGRAVTEGALHMAAIVYNSATQTLSIYDEQGLGSSISTASLQDFATLPTDNDAYFRIGTDAPDHATLPGMIGPIYLWSQALSTSQIAQHWNYAKDPTGLITTYTRTAAAIVPIGPDGSGNAQACVMSPTQVALAYHSVLTNDVGSGGTFAAGTPQVVTASGTGYMPSYVATGYGLAVGPSCTNLVPDVTFTGGNWSADASTTLTQGQVDPTGRPRGVLVAGDASNGLICSNIPLAASPANVTLVFWAKQTAGGTSLDIQLQNSSGVVKNTQNVTLTSTWSKFVVTFSAWDGSTATAKLRFVSHSGVLTFALAGIMCAAQGTDVPAILPLPGQTHGAYNAVVSASLPKQFNYEGELIAEGVSMIASPTPTAGTLVQATIGTTANQRELQIASGSTGFTCKHYDSAGTAVSASSAYSTYATQIWRARARWALCGMLDNVSPQDFSAVAWTDDAHTTPTVVTGRTATWTITATNLTTINIGTGTAAPSDVILRKVIVRSREEKLL